MKVSKIFSILLALVAFLLPVMRDGQDNGFIVSGVAHAQEDWKNEFDDICGKTQNAADYSSEELTHLIDRCNRLMPLIEKLDQTQRKVYLKRLLMCRDLFVFALESKEKK